MGADGKIPITVVVSSIDPLMKCQSAGGLKVVALVEKVFKINLPEFRSFCETRIPVCEKKPFNSKVLS